MSRQRTPAQCYLRRRHEMFGPEKDDGSRDLVQEHKSINKAKKQSRELMAQGQQIVTTA